MVLMQKARVLSDASKDFKPTKNLCLPLYCNMHERNTLLPNNSIVRPKLFCVCALKCCA